VVFFLGQGLLEVSGHAAGPAGRSAMIWIQVRDVHAEHARLAVARIPIIREPAAEPWGLIEMWIEDPDGIRIALSRFPPITLSAATCDQRHRGDEPYAAIEHERRRRRGVHVGQVKAVLICESSSMPVLKRATS
jgi:hypothetical protein